MRPADLHNITNSFRDVRLISLKSWSQAGEFEPRDRGGPYIVTQEGYDSEDLRMRADEFVLGRSGKWLSLSLFFRLPVAERRAEFVFGTAAEVMEMMGNLPSKVAMFGRPSPTATTESDESGDDLAAAFDAGKSAP